MTPTRAAWGPPHGNSITWHDPATLVAAGADPSGRELLQAIADGRLPEPPMAALIGSRLLPAGVGFSSIDIIDR